MSRSRRRPAKTGYQCLCYWCAPASKSEPVPIRDLRKLDDIELLVLEATEDHSFWERADLEEFDAERAYDESLFSAYQEGDEPCD